MAITLLASIFRKCEVVLFIIASLFAVFVADVRGLTRFEAELRVLSTYSALSYIGLL